jgi:signal transduction histidine kinase
MDTALTLLARDPSLTSRAVRAHAIKNCLAVIHAVQHLIALEVTGESRDRLGRAQDAVLRMRALLAEDVVSARGAAEDYCGAEDVVRAVVARVEDRAEAGSVELFVRCGSGGVRGVREDLVEALANVVLNAIEVTPAQAAVFITTCEASDGAQLWTVRDMGPGIPADVLARLGSPIVSSKDGGWGLGVAVARAIVGRHGGLLRFESSPSSGTVVSMWLPCGSEP